eukprot:3559994-Ditylum_brightwellii.AAC.1
MSKDEENEECVNVFVDPSGNPIPCCYNIAFLTPILPISIAHWDKTHMKVVLGCPQCRVKIFRRKKGRDELCGNREEGEVSSIKFPGEVRLLLGFAVVQLLDGTIVGQRCTPFDYTAKTVCSEKDMHNHERKEMHRM